MTQVNNGGPAFGNLEINGGVITHSSGNITVGDYFAGQALIGLLSSDFWTNTIFETAKQKQKSRTEIFSKVSYEFSDAMLKAREAKDE